MAASPTFTPTDTDTQTPSPTATVTFTLTPSPTATPVIEFWRDDFNGGTPGLQPAGWQDETDVNTYNAEIAYSFQPSLAAVTRTAEDVWGKVFSPLLHCDTSQFGYVEVKIAGLSPTTTWKIGIQEYGGSWTYQSLCASQSQIGTFIYPYASAMGWSGTKDFYVQLTVEGGVGKYLVADYVSVRSAPPTPTASPTPTPSFTPDGPTSTPTRTPTPSALTADIWHEDFTGTAGLQPSNWFDETDDATFNAEINYSGVSSAAIVRTAEDVWGKVLSSPIRCDVNAYNRLEINVSSFSSAVSWKVGILENGTSNYWDLCASQTTDGVFEFDYAQIIGWSGEKDIVVQITVEGAAGEQITVESVRVFGNRRQAAAGDFVRVSGADPEQLELQGTIVKIKGANYYPSAHGWQKMWVEWDQAMIETELSRATGLGFNTIRTFIHYDEFGGAAVKPEMLARMEQFLYFADKAGLKVEFTFFPYTRNYSPATRTDQKNHVRLILERFRDDDRILGWGVTNELDVYVALVNGDLTAHPYALDWHQDLAGYMQSLDPNHLVIAATAWPDSLRSLDLAPVDVVTIHYYDRRDAYIGAAMQARTLMQSLGQVKPILFEEFGMDFNLSPPAAEVSDYFTHVWDSIYQTDLAGGLVWLLNDTEQDGTPHLMGLFTAAGLLRSGAEVNATAYTGSNLKNPGPVPRPSDPWTVVPPAAGGEQIMLNTQLPGVTAQWTPVYNRAQFAPLENGVRIYDLYRGAEPYGYGSIEKIYPFSVDMDQEADLRIDIKDLYGKWYAFLSNTPSGYSVRMHYDSPVKGAFKFNLRHYLPLSLQSGLQYFTVAVGGVESQFSLDNSWVLVENVSVVNGNRPTPSPTPADTFWLEDFNGTFWVQPPGWSDESENPAFDCHLAYSASPSCAALTRTADDTWGKVLSPALTCNVSQYNRLELRVLGLSPGAVWNAGIQENGGAWSFWTLMPLTSQTGSFVFDIPTVMGRSGSQSFFIQLTLEGSPGSYLLADSVRIYALPPTPTPTFTISPTPDNAIGAGTLNTATPSPTPWLEAGRVMVYPNPARNRTTFAYTRSGNYTVTIDIYQLAGERVAHLIENQQAGRGQTMTLLWNCSDQAPGVYLARIRILDANGRIVFSETKKVAIIR
ncbi:MAG: T9SS type A sorting domain-containing protein [candidate division FCPU426 bacterium]